MSLSVVFLETAEQDIKELKHYVFRRFGVETAPTLSKLKESIHTLRLTRRPALPTNYATSILALFRQIISGRIGSFTKSRQETIYIHIVCDNRRDMQGLLNRRMMRSE